MKAVLFDLDGTLLESETYWRQSAIRLLCSKDISLPEYILETVEHTLFREQLKLLLNDRSIDLGMDFDACVRWCLNDVARLYATTLQLKPGARELLTRLRATGVKLALATASPEPWVLSALQRLGVLDCFDRLYCGLAGDAPLTKANPACFEKIAAELGVEAQDCVLVDDALYALTSAEKAGVGTWAVAERTRKAERADVCAQADRYFEDLFALAEELVPLAEQETA